MMISVVGLASRLLISGLVVWRYQGSATADDSAYLRVVEAVSRSGTAALEPDELALWSKYKLFLGPLVLALRLIGDSPLAAMLVVIVAGVIAAVCVHVVLRRLTSPVVALVGGLAAALWPSQVLWSSLILRDAFMWMALSALAVVLTWWNGSLRLSRLLPALAAVLVLLVYISGSRRHTLLVACFALGLAVVLTVRRHRLLLASGAAVAVLVVPWAVGLGPAGSELLQGGTAGRQEELTAAVEAGKTTIACVVVPFGYEAPSDGVGWSGDLQCLPSGLRMMLLDPFPNQLHKSRSLWPAFAEHVLWYPALALAAVGVVTTFRRRAWTPALAYTGFVWLGSAVMWGLVDRNFGTGYRHRGEFVWCVVVFAAIGGQHLWQRRGQPSPSADASVSAGGASSAASPSTAD